MIDIDTLTQEQFARLPLVVEGESKEVRYAGGGLVVIRFKPTIYSFTANRSGVVPGSDMLRLRATKVLVDVLKKAGIRHTYRAVNDRWALSELVLQPAAPRAPSPFRPSDVALKPLPMAPPIEVVVKRMHSGTSKHRYFGMAGHPVRPSHRAYAWMTFEADGAYPEPIVRFDWRNPLVDPSGKRLADEVLGDQMADWFINIAKARATALAVFDALARFLNTKDVVCYDLCLFIAEDGETVYGEVSQDCGRYRHFDLGSLDKDVWRAGGSSEMVLEKWRTLYEVITK